jgi:hypothetical protein
MIDVALEVVKALGTIGGLVAPAFLIWDRVVRDRPRFALHMAPGQPHGNRFSTLLIKNVMDEDLIIDSIVSTPSYLTPALDRQLESIVRAAAGEFDRPLIVEPLGECTLPLVIQKRSDGNENAPVKIVATWRATRRRWFWKGTVTITTSVAQVKELEAARPGKRAA